MHQIDQAGYNNFNEYEILCTCGEMFVSSRSLSDDYDHSHRAEAMTEFFSHQKEEVSASA